MLARHAEADSNVGETVSGIPPGGALTPAGVEQSRVLGRALAAEAIDLAVVTDFRRTQETADVALEGRDVPRLVLADLNEIRYGGFEGQSVWFYVKMGLVVVILAAMTIGAIAKPGTLNPRLLGWIIRLAMAGIIISAVMAFN